MSDANVVERVPLYVPILIACVAGVCACAGGWAWGFYERRWLGGCLALLGVTLYVGLLAGAWLWVL